MRFSREIFSDCEKRQILSTYLYFPIYFLNKEIECSLLKRVHLLEHACNGLTWLLCSPAEGNGTLVTHTYIVRKISMLAAAACNLHFRSHTRSYNVPRRRRLRDAVEKRRAGSPQETGWRAGREGPQRTAVALIRCSEFRLSGPRDIIEG